MFKKNIDLSYWLPFIIFNYEINNSFYYDETENFYGTVC